MITYDRYLAILAESDASVRGAAEAAFARLLEKIRAGDSPQAALKAVLKEFNAGAIAGFAEALNAIMESSLGPKEIAAYKVGKVKLSDALYANAQAVAANTQQIIEKHLQGIHNARELRKALYEGYDFQDDPLHIVKPLPKYLQVEFDRFKAAALKTPALRAAYLEAIRKAEAGAGMDELEKALRVAFYERNRYFANRIARTELHRNYTDKLAKELMDEAQIEYVQIRLSSKHPKTDICDRHAKLDAYGLGPGVYPKADAPKPPFHPHCLPGDALITASGRITAVSKRWYDGNMAVITTASGQKLAATVNHPVLTPSGWIAIGALQVGQQVVCRFSNERPSFADIQHQDVPTRIAEIADTFFSSRQVTAREVPTSTPDFHGDGMAGQIAVIGADSQLWDRFDAASNEAVKYNLFMFATDADTLFGERILDFRLEAFGPSAHSSMSGFRPSFSQIGRCIGGFEPLSLNDTAMLNALSVQTRVDRYSADLQFLGDAQDGTPGQIFVDDVVGIEIKSWSGHVYNLETEQGHYTSNNIITHNCYCLVSPKIDIFNANPRFNPKAEQAFLAKLDPKEARDIAGSWEKLARAKGGQSLEEIYNQGKAPLYRWKRLGDIEDMTRERESRFEAARTDVVEYGKKTGSERLVVLDAKTGKRMEVEDGTPDGMILTDAIMALIDDSNNAVRLTHNHPKNSSFSMEDIIVASKPGAESMEAVGHDGSWYRTKRKTADVDLEAKLLEMNDEVMNRLGKLVSGKKIKLDSAGQLYHHMVNLALAEIGVIYYEYWLSAPQEKIWMSLEPELSAVVREAATQVGNV